MIGVAVPAAGWGRRMGGARKPFLELAGRPVLYHALIPFLRFPEIVEIVVALASDEVDDPPEWLTSLDPRIRIVAGGETRTESVRRAVLVMGPEIEIVCVHDAARPLLEGAVIEACLTVAREGAGAVAGHPAIDTLKESGEGGGVVRTLDRSRVWQAQTPQVFPRALLEAGYARFDAKGLDEPPTDDASLVEGAGGTVRMVSSGRWNLKVTRPDDLPVAEALLAARRPRRIDVRPGLEGELLHEVADHLRAGGLIAYPTDTVYGFGSLPEGAGLERLLDLKGRDPDRPLLVLVAEPGDAPELHWTELAEELASVFWPGGLTLVLDDPDEAYPLGVRGSAGTVALRQTPRPEPAALVRLLGRPITSTSANAPGRPAARSGEEAFDAAVRVGAGPELWVLDAGELDPSEPSTIVDVRGSAPRLIREGAVPAARLGCALPGDRTGDSP